jgi:alkylhydroperoxidase/carboxymuconolactone decarboxylase family protein YurZ
MQPEDQNQAFASFAAGVRQNDILDPKTTRLIFLAVSMAIGCYP